MKDGYDCILNFRECPNVTCKELNTPDAPFCAKCGVPLTVAAHIEQGHQKDQEMQQLKERMDKMGDVIMHLDSSVKFYKNHGIYGGIRPASSNEQGT
jgi:hypothetical protein